MIWHTCFARVLLTASSSAGMEGSLLDILGPYQRSVSCNSARAAAKVAPQQGFGTRLSSSIRLLGRRAKYAYPTAQISGRYGTPCRRPFPHWSYYDFIHSDWEDRSREHPWCYVPWGCGFVNVRPFLPSFDLTIHPEVSVDVGYTASHAYRPSITIAHPEGKQMASFSRVW